MGVRGPWGEKSYDCNGRLHWQSMKADFSIKFVMLGKALSQQYSQCLSQQGVYSLTHGCTRLPLTLVQSCLLSVHVKTTNKQNSLTTGGMLIHKLKEHFPKACRLM